MRKIKRISFSIVCVLQVILAAWFGIISFINLLQGGGFVFLLQAAAYFVIAWLPLFALTVLSNNYPDRPIIGMQKNTFNWLFLINTLLLSFLFAFVFREYQELSSLRLLTGKTVFRLPAEFLVSLFTFSLMVICHILILYGLYRLRILLSQNFLNKKFEFESTSGRQDRNN